VAGAAAKAAAAAAAAASVRVDTHIRSIEKAAMQLMLQNGQPIFQMHARFVKPFASMNV